MKNTNAFFATIISLPRNNVRIPPRPSWQVCPVQLELVYGNSRALTVYTRLAVVVEAVDLVMARAAVVLVSMVLQIW